MASALASSFTGYPDMTIAALFEDSATIGTTEYSLTNDSTTLAAQTSDGIVQTFLDLSALTVTETYSIKVYEKVAAAGTQRKCREYTVSGVQSNPHFIIDSFIGMHGWDISVTKIAGTDRSIGWSIRVVS
jgi:hypothetical protein